MSRTSANIKTKKPFHTEKATLLTLCTFLEIMEMSLF